MISEHHPLYGKETVCHLCDGPAVWVFNSDMVGSYHYCRACKVETGPFARDVESPQLTFSEWADFFRVCI